MFPRSATSKAIHSCGEHGALVVWLGYVVDFLHVLAFDYPIFNVADVCLFLGVAVLFFALRRGALFRLDGRRY
ncbi:MAG: signal peptidase II [Myxococcota bacterium]